MSQLLNVPEAAQILRIAIPTLRKWTAEGLITHVRLGRRILYRREDLNQHVNTNVVEAEQGKSHKGNG